MVFKIGYYYLAVRAYLILRLSWVGVSRFGIQRWQQFLCRVTRPGRLIEDEQVIENRIKMARYSFLDAIKFSRFQHNCVTRSITMWWLLRELGIESDIRIGVNSTDQFRAHAWVERNGEPINPDPHTHKQYALFEQPIQSPE